LRTREPGGAQGAERLRGLLLDPEADWSPFAETLLHFAARAEHLARTIRPTLAAGMWVVCDRFADSTMAYQGYGLEGDRGRIAALTAMLDVRPDLTLVLDVPVETSVVRLRGRGGQVDRYEKLGADFFARIRNGFRLIAEADPGRCVLVSADGDEATVAERIWGVVESRFLRRNRQPDPPPHGRERGKKERLQHSPSPALVGVSRQLLSCVETRPTRKVVYGPGSAIISLAGIFAASIQWRLMCSILRVLICGWQLKPMAASMQIVKPTKSVMLISPITGGSCCDSGTMKYCRTRTAFWR